AAAPIFDSVAAARSGDLRLMAGGTPAMITTYRVTGNYFSTLGVRPLLGSPIVPAQIKAGRGDVIVLSYAFWQRQFGGDPAVIGKHVTPLVAPLDMSAAAPSSYTIIGVMPPGFHSPGYGGAEAWTPLVMSEKEKQWHGRGDALIVARLKSGVSVAQANAALRVFTAALVKQYPVFRGSRFDAHTLLDDQVQPVRLALL